MTTSIFRTTTLGLLRTATLGIALATGTGIVGSLVMPAGAEAAVVNRIEVRGNRRVDAETVRSYVTVRPGRSFSSFDTDESLRALFATGLFRDVRITQSGGALVVFVDEYPIVSRVVFEGNDRIKEEQLRAVVRTEGRSVLNDETLASDRARVRGLLRASGRGSGTVETEIVDLGDNRVNVVFRVVEGGRTRIRRIEFVGNGAFGDRRLREVVSLNESNLLSWLRRDDVYDPDKLRADEERLRRFYYNRGYADFQVISSNAELNEAENEYVISFTIEEGERYSFGNIDIDSTVPGVDGEALRSELEARTGDTYSAEEVEESLVAVTERIATDGYAFAQVTPRGERNFDTRTIDITFFVDEGPRVYVDNIIIRGNTRTRDYVIRREFDIAEGDAYNRVLVNRAKKRLEGLGFFESVRVSTEPGSAPDRVDVVVDVVDKATGELAIGGGYSSNGGPVGELSFSESNFLGRGQFVKVVGGFGQDSRKYQLSFTEPYFLGRRLAAGFDLSFEELEGDDDTGFLFDRDVLTFRPRLTTRLTEHLSFGLNYTYKREDAEDPGVTNAGVDLVNCGPGGFSTQAGAFDFATQESICASPYVTSSVGWSLAYANVDSLTAPREGVRAIIAQDFAGLGGDASYIRTTGKIAGYWLANSEYDIVVSGLAGAGHIAPIDGSLRTLDNFFGGPDLVRGFEPGGIGPRAFNDQTGFFTNPLGGTTYANATAEVQFPMPLLPRSFGLRGALFADAATLYGNESSAAVAAGFSPEALATLDDSALRASVGASILWDSPFGPLRADFAHPIAKTDYDRTQFFKFGVSTRF